MLYKMMAIIVLVLMKVSAMAQLSIKYNDVELNYPSTGINYCFVQSSDISNGTLQKLKHEWQPLTTPAIPISYVSYATWLKIPIQAFKQYGPFEYVNIDNPHINFVKCWIVRHDTIIKEFELTGDNLKYGTRQLAATTFVFPVNSYLYQDCDIVLAADKRFTKLDIPIIISTASYFVYQHNNKSLLFGIIIGFCFLLLLFNIYLFITIKQRFYLWYGVYLFLVVVYLFANGGFLFKYIIPNAPQFNDVVRPIALSLFEVPLLLFFIKLIDVKSRFPKLFGFIQKALIFYVASFIIASCFLSLGGFKIHGILLKVMGVFIPAYLVFYVCLSLYFVIRKVQFAVFAFLSFLLFTIFIFVYSFQQKELIVSTSFTKYANYWAIFSETVIATSLLAWQYKFYRDRASALQQQNVLLQQEIFKETAGWQEKEMQRMSSFLHDTVGANLGFLRLETDNMQLTEDGRNRIATHITRIGNEVRNMSHSFSPIVLQDKGLYNAVHEMVNTIKSNSSIDLQFEWLGEKDSISFQYQIIIYRILQELMQNMLKHANAQNAFLQVIIQEQLVSIYVEDDGVGISGNSLTKGVGLKSIENLMQLLKGNMRVQSKENDGFNISIEFNQYQ